MLTEPRRRAVLAAMQVDCWLPRARLPFAAAPRAHMLKPTARALIVSKNKPPQGATIILAASRDKADKVRVQLAIPTQAVKKAPVARFNQLLPPRFSLQLLRVDSCLLLMDCPYGEFLQSREAPYLLLLDILRAAHLPFTPKPLGEPVNWPLLSSPNVAQDADAARDYVQSFVRAQLETQPCACLWLFGEEALRFAAGAETTVFHELYIEGLCNAWALPALDKLLETPVLKRALWQSMQRLMTRWKGND